MRAIRRGTVAESVLVAAFCGGIFTLGCGAPEGADPSLTNDQASSVTLELTTVPSSTLCIRVTATPSAGAAIVKSFIVTPGASSANLQFGVLQQGSYVFAADAFNVACTSISGAGNWVADPVTTTVRPGVPSNLTMTFRKNTPVGITANFVNNAVSVAENGLDRYVVTDSGLLMAGAINLTIGACSDSKFCHAPFTVFDSSTVPGNAVVAVAATEYGACAIRADGTAWCWGGNFFGELGPAVEINHYAYTPVQVPGVSHAKQIAAGKSHVCVAEYHGVTCWGDNNHGQLGNGTTTPSSTPVTAFPWDTKMLAAGPYSTYAVDGNGGLMAWGSNQYGQLGDGTTTDLFSPTWIGPGVQMIAPGGAHACSLGTDSTVRCWGYNGHGQLGNGTTTSTITSPHPLVLGLGPAKQVVAGASHSCALTTAGQTMCWGEGVWGELGNGNAGDALLPESVNPPVPFTSLFGGGDIHATCGIASTLDVYCWGENRYGGLGDGTRNGTFLPTRLSLK